MILLAAPDESSLAAKKKQQHRASETTTSTPKNRVWNFENTPHGQISFEADLSAETATGSVQFSYESASGRAHYYTRDHLGSVRELTDGSGNIDAQYDYDPYGRTTLVSGTNLSDFQYAGYYVHQPSGLNLTMFRAYDSNTARWLSRDPMGEGADNTLYSYVWNSPTNLIDPLGLAGKGGAWFYPNHQAPTPNPQPLDSPEAGDIVGGAFVALLAAPVIAEAGTSAALANLASRFPWLVPAAAGAKKAADALNGQSGSCPAKGGPMTPEQLAMLEAAAESDIGSKLNGATINALATIMSQQGYSAQEILDTLGPLVQNSPSVNPSDIPPELW